MELREKKEEITTGTDETGLFLESIRQKMVDGAYPVFAVLGALGLIVGAIDPISDGNWILLGVYGALCSVILFPLVLRNRNRLLRTYIFTLTLTLLAFSELFYFAYGSLGYITLLTTAIVIALLHSSRQALCYIAAVSIGVWVIAWIYTIGILDLSSPQRQIAGSLKDWLGPFVGFITFSVSSIFLIRGISGALIQNLSKLNTTQHELKRTSSANIDMAILLNSILDGLPGIVSVYDLTTKKMVLHNSEAVKLLGYTDQELDGMSIGDLSVGKIGRAKIDRALKKMLKDKVVNPLDNMVQTKDGSVLHIHYSSKYIELHGKPHVVVIGIDKSEISELRQLHEQLKESQEKLVANERKQVIDEFITGFGHEINTPIGMAYTAATHAAEIAQCEDGEDGEQQEAICLINQCLREAISILKRMESLRQFSPVFKSYTLKELVVTALSSVQTDERSPEIVLDLTDDEIKTDLKIFGIAFHELVSNAIEYAFPEGAKTAAPEIRITGRISKTLPLIRIEIRDNGVGMSSDMLKSVANPFYSRRKSRGHRGSGLGLYLADFAVSKLLGGDMVIKAEKNKGTTIKINIPCQEESA